jgi:ABC-type glycerol-3-phosphate transport system substrate-binding protein
MFRKILAMCITLVLGVALVSCAKHDSANVDETPGFVWTQTETELPIDSISAQFPKLFEGAIYYFNMNSELNKSELYKCETDSEAPIKIEGFEAYIVTGFAPLADGNAWIIAVNETMTASLRKFELATGKTLLDIPLSASDDPVVTLVNLTESTAGAVVSVKSGDKVLKSIDEEAKILGDSLLTLPMEFTTSGLCVDGQLIGSSFDTLTKLKISDSTVRTVLKWLDNDLNRDAVQVLDISEDEIMCISLTVRNSRNNNATLIKLKKTSAADIKAKKVITFGFRSIDSSLRQAVVDFNRTDPDYRIELRDYLSGQTITEEAYNEGMIKLNTDIIAGNAPDILLLGVNYPVENYIEKGLLEDLSPYIEKETEFQLHPLVDRLCRNDDIMFQIAIGFTLMTSIGKGEVVGNSMGWTMKEAQAMLADKPGYSLLMDGMDQYGFFTHYSTFNLYNFYNKYSGEARFNSDEFKEALNYMKTFPIAPPASGSTIIENINDENYMIIPVNIGAFETLLMYNAWFADDLVYKGFPSPNKQGSCVEFVASFSMSSSCEYKEGAWRFLRTFLLEDFQSTLTYCFPANLELFEEDMAEIMEVPGDDDLVTYIYGSTTGATVEDPNGHEWNSEKPKPKKVMISYDDNGTIISEVEMFALTTKQASDFNELLESIDRLDTYDTNVTNIIYDEIGAFLEDQKSVDDVCENIQSRVELYLNERK